MILPRSLQYNFVERDNNYRTNRYTFNFRKIIPTINQSKCMGNDVLVSVLSLYLMTGTE